MTAEDKNRLQELVIRSRSYQQALQQAAQQFSVVEKTRNELSDSLATIKEFPDMKKDEIFVPLGGGVYSKCKLLDTKKFLVMTQAGVFVDKSPKEATLYLEKQISRVDKNLDLFQNQIQSLQSKISELDKQAAELHSKTKE